MCDFRIIILMEDFEVENISHALTFSKLSEMQDTLTCQSILFIIFKTNLKMKLVLNIFHNF